MDYKEFVIIIRISSERLMYKQKGQLTTKKGETV